MTIQTDQRIVTDRDVNLNAVSPGFFATLGIRIVAGRDFDERDSRPAGETGQRSAIVNEAFVKRYLGAAILSARASARAPGPTPSRTSKSSASWRTSAIAAFARSRNRRTFRFSKATMPAANFYVRVRGTPEQAFQSIRTHRS